MQKLFFYGIFLILLNSLGAVEDFRPPFNKSGYKKHVWTQVNGFWSPAKQCVDESGGPDYARMRHPRNKKWGSAAQDANHNLKLNFQVELHADAPGFGNTMKQMLEQAKEFNVDMQFSIFLVPPVKKNDNIEVAAKKIIKQFNMLRKELKSDPAIFRVDGCPVISLYFPGGYTPKEWAKIIGMVEKEFGRFLWFMNAGDNCNVTNVAEKVRAYLPYLDGVSMYGNWGIGEQQKVFDILVPIMRQEFPQKIFEASVQNAYANHFHFGGVDSKLSKKYRDSWDTVLSANPDSIVMTNFFDHYENSLILPSYEREDFLLRYAGYKLIEYNGNNKFLKSREPELVLTSYTSVMLGRQNLDFEIISFPIEHVVTEVDVQLSVCNTAGNVLYKFPKDKVNLKNLTVKSYSLPSTKFAGERGITAKINYFWNGKNFETPFQPITLISPSIRPNLTFYARSTRNALIVKKTSKNWSINSEKPGETLKYPENGLVAIKSQVENVIGNKPNQNCGRFRIMRNGLEFYSLYHHEGINLVRSFSLPNPVDALNYYHLEAENELGYRYQTLPVWVSNLKRNFKVEVPILTEDNKIKSFSIMEEQIPYFYYPCREDTGSLLLDYSGYQHNGRIGGSGFGGGHLGYTGYYHYHNGRVAPINNSYYQNQSFYNNGGNYILFHGGTAFPGASTYEISIKPDELGRRMGIISSANNQINLSILSDGRVELRRGSPREKASDAEKRYGTNKFLISKTKLTPGEWANLAVTYDLTELVLYINGKKEDKIKIQPSRGHEWINHIMVGAECKWLFTPENFFKGEIREIRFYGRNLKPKEFLKVRNESISAGKDENILLDNTSPNVLTISNELDNSIILGKKRAVFSKKTFSVNPDAVYKISFTAQNHGTETILLYGGFAIANITSEMVHIVENTATELIEDANVGSNIIKIAKKGNWQKGNFFIASNIKDNFSDLPNEKLHRGGIDKITETETSYEVKLKKPLLRHYNKGEKLRLHKQAIMYNFINYITLKPKEKSVFYAEASGISYGSVTENQFWPGTEKFKLIICAVGKITHDKNISINDIKFTMEEE